MGREIDLPLPKSRLDKYSDICPFCIGSAPVFKICMAVLSLFLNLFEASDVSKSGRGIALICR